MRRSISLAATGAAAIVLGAFTTPAAMAGTLGSSSHPGSPEVVVTGLNNPRQLSWRDHALVIAEAGSGGGTCVQGGPEGAACFGNTGSISLVNAPRTTTNASPRRVITGLLSSASPDGGSAVGSDGVSVRGNDFYIAMTFAPPDLVPQGVPGAQAGKLLKSGVGGHVRTVADIAAVEEKKNPAGGPVDSNPYGVLALPGRQIVADAAGNDLIEVRNGHTRVLTVLPKHGCGGVFTEQCDGEATPTSVALGPDGNLYVGELAHLEPGAARVWKISPSGKILGWIGGFTSITGLAFGEGGALYVSQLFAGGSATTPPGLLTKVAAVQSPHPTRTSMAVPLPGGVAVEPGSNLVFVSAWSISDSDGAAAGPGMMAPPGQVWRMNF